MTNFDGKYQENEINFEGMQKPKRQKEDSHIGKIINHPVIREGYQA